MKKLLLKFSATSFIMLMLLNGCKQSPPPPPLGENLTSDYAAKIATDWFTLEADLIKSTPTFGPGPAGRALAYSGLALYESVVSGMPSHQSVFHNLSGLQINGAQKEFYWPACANAAMAAILKNIFSTTSAANVAKIDSLEKVNFNNYLSWSTNAYVLNQSVEFGKNVAGAIFNWSKTDGFLNAIPAVSIPTGPGKWVNTPPAFAPAIATNWGTFRSFVPMVASLTQPVAPLAYSIDPGSEFYKMADFVYQKSLNLTAADTALVRTWGDLPGNYNGQTHLNKVLTQLLIADKSSLEKAAFAYATHGMAIADGAISVFQTKYTYWLIRPVSYIRSVMGKSNWNTVIPTPPHPEYSAAHAVISGASEGVLESFFGTSLAFTDHTHNALYGPRSYNSIREFAEGSGWSRVLGGIHYKPSVDVGLMQGKKVAELILKIPFKK